MHYKKWVLITVIIFIIASCASTRKSNREIENAMKQYDHLIKKLDADSIALLYTPDGNLGNIVTGRDSIRKFLSSFKNVEVLSQSSSTESISIQKDSSMQKGKYWQTDLLNGKDTIKVKGTYIATWVWIPKQGWHIKRMLTSPIK